ncbi:hypothetical protein AVEN_358-1 [Araneus ventricosus]|nr:hypothetical protein AVEN_110070-1 [Araneus ventricosus]GBO22574.1 hypothetical protein AVEN_358-1 [Araneus ventricosus]
MHHFQFCLSKTTFPDYLQSSSPRELYSERNCIIFHRRLSLCGSPYISVLSFNLPRERNLEFSRTSKPPAPKCLARGCGLLLVSIRRMTSCCGDRMSILPEEVGRILF